MREVAAFLLDYDQFAHVPNTVFGMFCRNSLVIAILPLSKTFQAVKSKMTARLPYRERLCDDCFTAEGCSKELAYFDSYIAKQQALKRSVSKADYEFVRAVRVTHNIFHITRPQPVSREGRTSFDSNLASSQGSATSYISNAMASTIKPQFSGSPPSKLASLQEFVQHQWDASEMGCSR